MRSAWKTFGDSNGGFRLAGFVFFFFLLLSGYPMLAAALRFFVLFHPFSFKEEIFFVPPCAGLSLCAEIRGHKGSKRAEPRAPGWQKPPWASNSPEPTALPSLDCQYLGNRGLE